MINVFFISNFKYLVRQAAGAAVKLLITCQPSLASNYVIKFAETLSLLFSCSSPTDYGVVRDLMKPLG